MDPRQPAEAGRFYPANEREARRELQGYFSSASARKLPVSGPGWRTSGLILPHAGWVFSGEVTAAGMLLLDPEEKYETVFLLGASHRSRLRSAAVWTGASFLTPLGEVPVSGQARELAECGGFAADPAPHGPEHSLEVILPFLQTRLRHPFAIVPVLFDAGDIHAALEAGPALAERWDRKSLMIVSSDFSHYPAYDAAVSADHQTLKGICSGRTEVLLESVRTTEEEGIRGLDTCACGLTAILAVMTAALRRTAGPVRPVPVLYMNSGDSPHGSRGEVVGYHAIAFGREE
jgi:AmmeMemoRadiSam system protein B